MFHFLTFGKKSIDRKRWLFQGGIFAALIFVCLSILIFSAVHGKKRETVCVLLDANNNVTKVSYACKKGDHILWESCGIRIEEIPAQAPVRYSVFLPSGAGAEDPELQILAEANLQECGEEAASGTESGEVSKPGVDHAGKIPLSDAVMKRIDGLSEKHGEGVLYEIRTTSANPAEQIQIELAVYPTSRIPSLWIEGEKPLGYLEADKSNSCGGRFTLRDERGEATAEGNIENIHGHGNSTWYEAKKSFQIKFPEKRTLLGHREAKKYLLISNCKDLSQIRNKVFYDMAEATGLKNSLKADWVDLYYDGEYRGLYLLTDKVEIGKNRLDIGDLEKETADKNTEEVDSFPNYTLEREFGIIQGWQIPEEPDYVTGGYLLELDYPQRFAEEPSKFNTTAGQYVVVKSPKYATAGQISYIYNFVQDTENCLFTENREINVTGRNPGGIHYTERLDMDSFVKRYLIDEISKNVDAGYSSWYFYKPKDEDKLYAGPAWDYDISLAGNNGWGDASLKEPEGLYAANIGWSASLTAQPEFEAQMKATFRKQFLPYLNKLLDQKLDSYEKQICDSARMDENRWRAIHPDADHHEEIGKVRDFLERRTRYLEALWSN